MWERISNFPAYRSLQSRHPNKWITYLLLQEHLWYILNFSFVWVLSNAFNCNYLLAWKTLWCITWNAFSFIRLCLIFRSFWLCLIVFVPMICLNDVFLRKAMILVALNTLSSILLTLDISQCLLIIFLIFGKGE